MKQSGFTLPELVVVGAMVGVLMVIAIVFARPHDYGPAQRNAERWTAAAHHLQAINAYVAARGELPPGLTAAAQLVGSEEGMVNLCPVLVPAYADDLLYDPIEATLSSQNCSDADAIYTTGFSVALAADRTLTVAAPAAEDGQTISLSKQF